jgi:hypothetical protein
VVETTMELSSWLRKQLAEASPDLLRVMVQDFAEALMAWRRMRSVEPLRRALAGARRSRTRD